MPDSSARPAPPSPDLRLEALRGRPGFHRLAPAHDGHWWLLTPDDKPFFPSALAPRAGDSAGVQRAAGWGFRAAWVSEASASADGLPVVALARLAADAPRVQFGGASLPDVFDVRWAQGAASAAQHAVGLHGDNPLVLAWRLDDDLAWAWAPRDNRPSLLQLALSLEPNFAAYHAAWEFALALHGGNLDQLSADWGVSLGNKETLREWTREERGIATPGYLTDHREWTEEWTRRYYATACAALRTAAPHHLIFSARLAASDPLWMGAIAAARVDAVVRQWSPERGAGQDDYPVWVADFTWADPGVYESHAGDTEKGVARTERMLSRGRAAAESLARDPRVIGWSWPAGPAPLHRPFHLSPELVSETGVENQVQTEALTAVNRQLSAWRTGS